MKYAWMLLTLLAAAPATAPQWKLTPAGQVLLRPFDAAPYPHASRANGYQSANGNFPADPHYTDSTVGIVIPTGYTPGNQVDYIVHFHGWSNHVSNVLTRYQLPEQLAASQCNAILLVPQGPRDAKDSGDGKLELDPGGFERLIREVTAFLNREGKIHTSQVGRIVLTAHSGGYKVVASILHHGGLADSISDVILLDASYGNLDWFCDFAAQHPTTRLLSFHTAHLDSANATLMGLLEKAHVPFREIPEADLSARTAAARGVSFISTTLAHDQVPMGKKYFQLALESSALDKVSGSPRQAQP